MAGSPRISDQAVYDLTSYSHCSFITNYRIKSLLKTLKSLEVEAVTPRGCLTGSSLRLARTTITANYCLATTAPPPASASTLAEVLWPGASDLWEYQRDQLCWNISFGKFGSNLENSFGIYVQNGQNKRRREKRFGTPGGWFEHRCGASQIGRALQTGRRCQHFCTFALLPAFLPCEANSWPMFVSSIVMSAAWTVRMTSNHKTISYC